MRELDKLRTILANERTLLAYVRTALALLIFGMAAIKFFPRYFYYCYFRLVFYGLWHSAFGVCGDINRFGDVD